MPVGSRERYRDILLEKVRRPEAMIDLERDKCGLTVNLEQPCSPQVLNKGGLART